VTGSRRATIVTCFAIVYLVWGSTYLVTKIGVTTLPPFLFGSNFLFSHCNTVFEKGLFGSRQRNGRFL
jgi:hypothetical protein